MAALNNFIIDRVRRAVMFSTADDSVLWAINQVTNPTLSVTSDIAEAVDALGVPIARFNRAKNAEFSAENSIFDLSLLAAQSGTTVDTSAADNTYTFPFFDEVKVVTADTLTLTQTPAAGTLKYLYIENGDGTLGTKFTVGDTASGNTVTLAGKAVTFASGKAAVGERFFAQYEITANGTTEATRVVNTANNFSLAGRLIVECIGIDPCDPTTVMAAYIEFPNAKLTSDFDITFGTDSTHPFTIQCMQSYCDAEKKLFSFYVPDLDAAV